MIEMVNATINENGKREITGKSLNLALMQIIEAMGESGGAGGVTIYFNGGEETAEQIAHNAEAFAQLKVMADAGQSLPPVVLDLTDYLFSSSGVEEPIPGVSVAVTPRIVITDAQGIMSGNTPAMQIEFEYPFSTTFFVLEDGTVLMDMPMSAMSTMSLKRNTSNTESV